MRIKTLILSACGLIGGLTAEALGGWDAGLILLLSVMAFDYATGLILAGVFKKSPKSAQGALESRAAWKGLCRKGVTLGVVFLACRMDAYCATSLIRDGTIIAYSLSELLSVTENLGLMGVPLPPVIRQAIERLQNKQP